MERIAIIGLGYVGLPLAVAFGKSFSVKGFDIDKERIAELVKRIDRTREVSVEELDRAEYLSFTDSLQDISDCNIFIVTVPTPIDESKKPDLSPLIKSSENIASVLKPGDLVIYESTVFPGATEEVCVPVLEKVSGLKFNEDFYVGYSPERINPGDKAHRLEDIKKVTSGSTFEVALRVDELYSRIITAGTHLASSIKVAEAAKVIENTQRDLNIALMNELAIIFGLLNIDTCEVLAASGTKWNFLPFKPGLVGGHCIGVDPYYLTHKSEALGYHPQIILAGRRVNDGMGKYVASEMVKSMIRSGQAISGSNILIMGLTFKENCPDLRNTKVIEVVKELNKYGCNVDVVDCWADPVEAKSELGVELIVEPKVGQYDGLIIAVPHTEYLTMNVRDFRAYLTQRGVIYDLKGVLPVAESDLRL